MPAGMCSHSRQHPRQSDIDGRNPAERRSNDVADKLRRDLDGRLQPSRARRMVT